MTNATAVADQVESELAPSTRTSPTPGGPSTSSRDEENERRRVELETALSDFLADNGRFAAIEAARENRGRHRPAPARSPPQRLPAAADPDRDRAPGSSSSRHRWTSRFSQHRGDIAGRKVDDNEIARDPARRATTSRSAARRGRRRSTVGALVARDVRELARLRNAGRAHARLPRLVRARRSPPARWTSRTLIEHAGRGRPRHRRAPFARVEGRRSTRRLAARFGCTVGGAPAPGTTTTPSSRSPPAEGGVDLDPLLRRTPTSSSSRRRVPTTASGSTCATVLDAQRPLRRVTGKSQHAFCIDIDRGGRRARARATSSRASGGWTRCCTSSGTRSTTASCDASLPWLAARRRTLAHHRGHRHADGPAAARPASGSREVAGVDAATVDRTRRAPLRRRASAALLVFAALGAGDDELRARALRRSRRRTSTPLWWDLVERYQLVTRPDGPRTRPTGRRRSTSRAARPSTTTTTSTGEIVRLAARRDARTGNAAGSSTARPRGSCSESGCLAPGLSVRWDRLIEQATGEPLTAAHFGRDIDGV